jgi:hypothetical protein
MSAMPTRDELAIHAAMLGLCSSFSVGEVTVRLPGANQDRVTVWFDSAMRVVAGPGQSDPRTFHTGWHEALREARARLRAGG